MKTVGIYIIKSPSSKVYIGQSWDIKGRFKYYKNQKAYQQPHLSNSIKKYGFDSHELKVLHELPNDVEQVVLDRYECFYIDAYRNAGFELMNLKEGGLGGKHHAESIKKISEGLRGKKKPKSFCEKISNLQKGRKHSLERIENMRKAKTGVKISASGCNNMAKAQLGRKHSEESKQKRREKMLRFKHSPESIEKMSAIRKRWHVDNPEDSKLLIQKMNDSKK